jgi:hypothetical protein
VVFCASHSGSTLLADLLKRSGVFIGSDLTCTNESTDLWPLLEHAIMAQFPDFSGLRGGGDRLPATMVRQAVSAHLKAWTPGTPWGFKLPQASHIVPLLDRLFPTARYIHLIRDGRDVALSPFVGPKTPMWRKVYFNTDRVVSWRGLPLSERAYRANTALFGAALGPVGWRRLVRDVAERNPRCGGTELEGLGNGSQRVEEAERGAGDQ